MGRTVATLILRYMDPQNITELPGFLTTKEFSKCTHLSVATVRRLCAAGQIASVTISDRGDRRIPVSEVSRLAGMAESNRSRDRDDSDQ